MKSFNDKRIKPYQNNNNGVVSINRNFGIKHSKGELISFCDDDDYWVQEKLEKQIEAYDENVIGVGTNAYIIGGKKASSIINSRKIYSLD